LPLNTRNKISVEPYTQWDPGVASPSSACGPATIAALVEYWSTQGGQAFIHGQSHFGSKAAHMNYIYSGHGGAPWGMSVRRLMRGIREYIQSSALYGADNHLQITLSAFNDFASYKKEIDAGRPVALKFDKWFTFRWRGKYVYDYHWVLGVGYEDAASGSGEVLIVLDHGVKTANGMVIPSRERRINYVSNKGIITMVSLNIEG